MAEVNCVNCVVSGPRLSERDIKTSVLMLTSALRTSSFPFLQFVLSSSDCGLNRATDFQPLPVALCRDECACLSHACVLSYACLCAAVVPGVTQGCHRHSCCFYDPRRSQENTVPFVFRRQSIAVSLFLVHKAKQVTAFSSGQH